MKRLVIIIEQEKSKSGGELTKTSLVGNEELWSYVKERVLKELLGDVIR